MVEVIRTGVPLDDTGAGNESLVDGETVEWSYADLPLRLVRIDRHAEPPAYRIDGHPDDAGQYASLRFTSDDARRRARLYLAVLLEAPHRPPTDPAHMVPRELLTTPRRYHSAFLTGATTNSASWVAHTLDIDTETVYSHLSRVRSDYPEIFDQETEIAGKGDR